MVEEEAEMEWDYTLLIKANRERGNADAADSGLGRGNYDCSKTTGKKVNKKGKK